MLPFLRSRRVLYRWTLSALVETAAIIPWLLVSYGLSEAPMATIKCRM